MILSQCNIIGFYDNKQARHWNISDNPEVFRVFLETNHIPAIQLIVDASIGATMELLDSNDEPVSSPISMTVEDGSDQSVTYKRLIYLGSILSGYDDGDYSIKITNGSNVYYSDVFGWTSQSIDLNDSLIKITANSSDIVLGRGLNKYVHNMNSFTFECYLNNTYLGLVPEVTDDVANRDGAISINYGNTVIYREFQIDGNDYIYRFLLALRMLECNGSIQITYKHKTYSANDISVEVEDDSSIENFVLKLKFTDYSEIISVYNNI